MLSKQLIEGDARFLQQEYAQTFLNSFIDKSLTPKCIFIHIPKCAGSTIRNNFHLVSSWEYHATAATFIEAFNQTNPNQGLDIFLSHHPFTVVRNPFDRVVSWFFYHRASVWVHGRYEPSDPSYNVKTTDPKLAFESWVLDRCPTHWATTDTIESSYHVFKTDPRPVAVWRQLNWLEYKDEVVVPDFNIIRYEKLEDTIPQLKDSGNDRRLKKSDRDSDYRNYYTNSKLIDIVTELCADDLDYFGYQFGD